MGVRGLETEPLPKRGCDSILSKLPVKNLKIVKEGFKKILYSTLCMLLHIF